jgi:hypothetical protein
MAKTMLSQHDALMIETLRSHGVSDDELINRIQSGNIESFQQIGNGDFDFTDLVRFAEENGDVFVQAVRDGYEIKFNTRNGIKYLLMVKFGKRAGVDYEFLEDRFERLALTDSELQDLRAVLSKYWTITAQERDASGRSVVNIKLGSK